MAVQRAKINRRIQRRGFSLSVKPVKAKKGPRSRRVALRKVKRAALPRNISARMAGKRKLAKATRQAKVARSVKATRTVKAARLMRLPKKTKAAKSRRRR